MPVYFKWWSEYTNYFMVDFGFTTFSFEGERGFWWKLCESYFIFFMTDIELWRIRLCLAVDKKKTNLDLINLMHIYREWTYKTLAALKTRNACSAWLTSDFQIQQNSNITNTDKANLDCNEFLYYCYLHNVTFIMLHAKYFVRLYKWF